MEALAGGPFLQPGWPPLTPAAGAWAALAVAGPLAALAMAWDLRRMRIPNRLNAALLLGFLPVGFASLPPEDALWRLAAALVVLVLGLAVFVAGKMGGGDVKMLAAAAPWVAPSRAGEALMLLSLALIAGLALVLAIRRLTPRDTPWRGLRRAARRYPMGLSIGAALIAHLLLALPRV